MSANSSDRVVDKSNWPPGPWHDEPDKLNWTTAAGLPGMIVRNPSGFWCGYVAVAPGHPLYEKDYDHVDADLDVHGGLTYADHCRGVICHVAEPGEPEDVWWFGFDCAHLGDLIPRTINSNRAFKTVHPQFAPTLDDVYRDVAYVRAEVEELAAQLAAAEVRA